MEENKSLKFIKRFLFILASFATIVLLLTIGGYIYALFHGYLNVSIRDVSLKEEYGRVLSARIHFHDKTGKVIGSGYTDEKYGAVNLNYPEFGDCSHNVSEKEKWYACRHERSRWSVKFAKKVSSISLETAKCLIEKIPVNLKVNRSEALTYWIPLPHVMGTPLTYFFINIKVDLASCKTVD